MRAKAKTLVIVAATCLCLGPVAASAQETVGERCEYLSRIDADKLMVALTSYAGKVMGKYPEHWTLADYSNLAANAITCNGLPENVENKVNAEFWTAKLTEARTRNADIDDRSGAIMAAYSQFWKGSGEFPACATFLRWKRDDVWYTNNSEELFGKPFMKMDPEELGFYKRLAQECRPLMGSILDRWRSHPDGAEGIVESMLSSIEMDANAAQEEKIKVPDSIDVYNGGVRVPISYLRPTTQKVVHKIIALENADRIMPTNALIQISKWAEQVETDDTDGPDLLYAQRIKAVVADHLFRSANALRAPRAGLD